MQPVRVVSPSECDTSVWLFTDVFPPKISGAAFIAEGWAKHLPQLGVSVRTFCPSGHHQRTARSAIAVKYSTLGDIGFPGDHFAIFSAVREIRSARHKRPDAVVVLTPGRVGLLGLAIAAYFDLPLIYVYSTDILEYAGFYSAMRPAMSVAFKLATVLTVSKRARQAILRSAVLPPEALNLRQRSAYRVLRAIQAEASHVVLLGPKRLNEIRVWSQTPCTVIPAGVDRLPRPSLAVARLERFALLYTGRLAREKNLLVLVEAVALLRRAGHRVTLTLVGEGEMRSALLRRAARLGVADAVTVPGPAPRSELRAWYAAADAFVFPSMTDTQALVLNEAALEGLPLVVADSEINSVAMPGISSLGAVPTALGFATAVEQLLNDPTLGRSLAAVARELALQRTERNQSAELARVIHDLLAH